MGEFVGFYVLGDIHDDEEETFEELLKFRRGSRDFNYLVIPLDSVESLVWVERQKAWVLHPKKEGVAAIYVGIDVQHLPTELLGKLPLQTRS